MSRIQFLAVVLGFGALASAALDCKTGASNGTVFTSGQNTYDILCNYQYGGDTIGSSKQASTFDICVGYCDTTAGCVDVVYDSSQYCYLKSSKTNGYASSNWYTAVKRTTTTTSTTTSTGTPATGLNCVDGSSNGTIYNSATAAYDIICNYQFNGNNLGASKYADTFAACVAFCDTTSGCVDVVYSSAKYCFLKSSKLSGYNSPGWWVAVKRASAPGPNLVQNPGFELSDPADSSLAEYWTVTGNVFEVYNSAVAHNSNFTAEVYADQSALPTLSQTITGLDTTKSYSFSFYYQLYYLDDVSNTGKTCTLTALLGGSPVYTKIFTGSDGTGYSLTWIPITITNLRAEKSSQELKFQYDCSMGGQTTSTVASVLFLDDVSFNTV